MNRTEPCQRKIYFDILRIIAIFFVIFNHTGTRGYFLFSVTQNKFTYWIYLFLSVLCKLAVPLFFMISGALLLPKNESIKKIYSKRILKYIIVILFFSFFWYLILTYRTASEFSVLTFLAEVYSTNMIGPYWFLYSYLAVLIMLPFIRKMAQGMNQSEFIYLFILFIVFTGIIPIFQFLAFHDTLKINMNIPIVTTSSIFYVMIGYFIEQLDINRITKKHFTILVLVSFTGIVISCILTYYKAFITGVCYEKVSQAFHGNFIAFPAITIYLTIKNFF